MCFVFLLIAIPTGVIGNFIVVLISIALVIWKAEHVSRVHRPFECLLLIGVLLLLLNWISFSLIFLRSIYIGGAKPLLYRWQLFLILKAIYLLSPFAVSFVMEKFLDWCFSIYLTSVVSAFRLFKDRINMDNLTLLYSISFSFTMTQNHITFEQCKVAILIFHPKLEKILCCYFCIQCNIEYEVRLHSLYYLILFLSLIAFWEDLFHTL